MVFKGKIILWVNYDKNQNTARKKQESHEKIVALFANPDACMKKLTVI